MDPISIGLIGVSALGKLGGILGGKKRKQIDPEMLKRLFGAKAITDEQMELFNRAINSSQGQQLLTSAAQQGQQFQTDVARRSAEAGLGPSGGASGGADIFAGAASESAVGNLQRGVRASLMEAMLPIAQQLVSDRMQAWLSDREKVLGQTTKFQDVMGAMSDLSSNLLAARQTPDTDKGAPASNNPADPGFMGPQAPPTSAAMTGGAPAGAAMTSASQPAGTQAQVGNAAGQPGLAMANPMAQQNTPGARDRNMRMLLSGGGRFARAMSNRFGAVQPAFGG